jgi:FkbM family methyltransferase
MLECRRGRRAFLIPSRRRRLLWLLSQYSPFERLVLALVVRVRRTLDRRAFYDESKVVFDHAFEHGFTSHREGGLNRLRFTTPELGTIEVLLRRHTSDFAVFRQCFLERQYKPLADLALASLGRARVTIVDAGANVGLAAIFLARSFPGARVFCIEPEPGNVEMCRTNLDLNGHRDAIVLASALWDTDGPVQLSPGFRDGREWARTVTDGAARPGGTTVDGVRLGALMERLGIDRIDILKLDVEGAEKRIFRDEVGQTSWLARTSIIGMEIHDEEGARLILPQLEKAGFFVFGRGEVALAVRPESVPAGLLLDQHRLRARD